MKVASPADLERDWSIDDVQDAHEILDALDVAEATARKGS
jgi:polysaccharide deacetylase 2 family uncharacterized protein YibQ